MKKRQRIMSTILMLAMLLTLTVPAHAAAAEVEDGRPLETAGDKPAVSASETEAEASDGERAYAVEQPETSPAPQPELSPEPTSAPQPELSPEPADTGLETRYTTIAVPGGEALNFTPAALTASQLSLPAVEGGSLTVTEAWSFVGCDEAVVRITLKAVPTLAEKEALIFAGLDFRPEAGGDAPYAPNSASFRRSACSGVRSATSLWERSISSSALPSRAAWAMASG